MAVAHFSTGFQAPTIEVPASSGEGGGSGKMVTYVIGALVIAGLGYLAYNYWYLPMQAKKQAQNNE
jgi:hypothetical protein